MRLAVCLLLLLLTCAAGRAANTPEEEALVLFEAACLHDTGQFDQAMAIAGERAMPVPPQALRDSLVDKGDGAVWIASDTPFLALHANVAGGCGIMLKPADEERLDAMAGKLEGSELVYGDKFQRSWTHWHVLKREGLKGVLIVGYFGDSDKPSGFLRYMPAAGVVTEAASFRFLLADGKIYRALVKGLAK